MNPFRSLLRLLRPCRALVAFAIISSFATTLSLLSFPVLTKTILGGMTGGNGATNNTLPIAETGLLACLLIVSSYLAYSAMFSATRKIAGGLRVAYGEHLLGLPVAFFRDHAGGDLVDRFSKSISDVEWFLRYTLLTSVILAFLFVGATAMLIVISWKLTALLLAVTALSAGLLSALLRRTKRSVEHEETESGRRSARLQELISGIELVKAYRAERREVTRMRNEESSDRSTDRIFAFIEPVLFTVAIVGLLTLMIAGRTLISAGELTLSDFIAFLMYTLLLVPQSRALGLILMRWQHFQSGVARIEEILLIPGEQDGLNDEAPAFRSGTEIRLDNISVVYSNGSNDSNGSNGNAALNNISLSFGEKESVGIVGPSGAGKTTIFHLLLRFCDSSSGTISVGGVGLSSCSAVAVRKLFALVPQDPFLFNTTLAENLRYGKPNASDDELAEACRIAHATEFISRFPERFQTVVGERGSRLSTGQRQRIAIARALLSEAPVLLMDEATSALDSQTEHDIREALTEIMRTRTVLIIAHRLATVVHLPRIVVIDKGSVIDDGTHDALLGRCQVYRRLVTTQFISADSPSNPSRILQ